jgi:GTP:adenosylcobinamide-phosphate guanylyltransferase
MVINIWDGGIDLRAKKRRGNKWIADLWPRLNYIFRRINKLIRTNHLYNFKDSEFSISVPAYTEYRKCTQNEHYEDLIDNLKLILKLHDLYAFREALLKSKYPIVRCQSENVIEDLKQAYNENGTVIIDSILPLIGQSDFIDLIIENKIEFSSVCEPELSRDLSRSLLYLSNKKGIRPAGNTKAYLNITKKADEFVLQIGPVLDELDKEDFKTLKNKADELNRRKIKTLRGRDWLPSTIRNTINRWQELKPCYAKSKKPKPE